MQPDATKADRLPVGTVTFLRTDVEGSMRLMRALGQDWDGVNGTHQAILRDAVGRHGGTVVRTEGDAVFAAFHEAGAGVLAAIDGQRGLDRQAWPPGADVRVRMGLHTGEAHLAGDDYGGFDVNRAARIAAVGHGGQIVVSGTTRALVESSLPHAVTLRDLGRHALRDVPIPEHLYQVVVPGLREAFPPLRVGQPAAGNLPDRLTSFVGRDRDLAELDAVLDRARLVTLTGPGGIGKTSVAVEVARKRAAQTPDGAWLVTLDSVSDPTLVLAEVARTLGLFDGAAHPAVEALPGFVAQRSMLLVLDNFEHLLDAARDVATLVRASPASRFIVTSRAALRLQGEHDYAMSPLALGAPGSPADPGDDPAARLFVDRARAVRSGWEPGRDEALVVADVCDLLDRLPLGIELAAARMAVLPVSAIRDRLQAHLPLPGAGPRDAPARQRTLEGAIGWSHDLLEPADQRILHELAVFEGGFDVAQAERVAIDGTMPYDGERGERGGRMGTDVLDRLVALAEQSLISRQAAQTGLGRNLAGTDARFGMLKTVQGFALARLATEGRESEVRRRHAVAFLDVAQEASRHMPASGQAAWLDRLTLDHANLRAALQWSVETGEVAIALALVGAMWRFWQLDGRLVEGRGWADAALTMPGAAAPTPERLAAITAAGGLAYWQGDRAASNDLYREQLALSEELGDAAATADAWLNLAASSFVRGDPTEAIHCGEEARRLFVELGDERGVNRIQWGLANMALDTLGPETALAQLLSVRDRAVELGDAPYAAITAGSLGWVSFMTGDPLGARRWTIRAMVEMYGLRDLASTTISLPACALVALDAGKPIEAAELMGAFEGLSERYGVRPPLGLAEMIGRQEPTGHIRELLTPDVLAASMERGRRMSVDEAVELVVSLGDASPTT